MGAFANTLFGALLGWLRGAAAWLWQLITGAEAGAVMSFVMDNWLMLVILLCAAGVAVDLVVYIIRWQPYRIWRRFLGGKTEAEEEDEAFPEAAPAVRRRWIYADGRSAPVEPQTEVLPPVGMDDPVLSGSAWPEREAHLDAPIRPVKRVRPIRTRKAGEGMEPVVLMDSEALGQAYNKPYYPPQWTGTKEHQGGRR